MGDWLTQLTTELNYTTLVLLIVVFALGLMIVKLKRQNDAMQRNIFQLQNEFRAMNSGHLGMGREIRKVAEEIAHVEHSQQQNLQTHESKNPKNFEQAGILLARGASIEEVVEACDISPGEAELLSIMRHSAPTQTPNVKRAELS